MAEQLSLVAELARRPNVDLRILRLDDEQITYLQHPCMIFEFAGPSAHGEALIETVTQDVRVTDRPGIALLTKLFERLASSALPLSDSLSYIDATARSYLDDRD
jgi:hypothetical protein